MNTLGKVIMFDLILYMLIAIFMSPFINQYLAGQQQLQNIADNYGVNINGTSASVDTNAAMQLASSQPNVGGITNSALNFLAPFLAVKDMLSKVMSVLLAPVLLLQLPDTIIPTAFKIFVILPMDVLAAIGIIGFIRGFFI